jgi:antibiotic biosynthesis monooxygenase (ABM) superfamily enzyme
MEHDNIFPAPDSGVQKTEKSIEIETESPPTLDQENAWIEDPNHPRNWPKWKKNSQILMVAFHSMGATFMAAGIIPANEAMAEEYGVALEAVSYFTAVQVRIP